MGHNVTEDNYLQHYGVLGMKWGVRKDGRPQGSGSAKFKTGITKASKKFVSKSQKLRAREKKLDTKIDNILAKDNVDKRDKKLFEEQRRPLIQRATRNAVSQAVGIAITDIITGQPSYSEMSKAEQTKRINAIVKNTIIRTNLRSAGANIAAKSYSDSGSVTKKRGVVRSEDFVMKADVIAQASIRASKLGRAVLFVKAETIRQERSKNEQTFKNAFRDGRILEDRVDDVITNLGNGATIISNPRPGAKDVTPKKRR